MNSILSLILIPVVFALLIQLLDKKWSSMIAILGSASTLLFFLYLMSGFKASLKVENVFLMNWIPGINTEMHFGLDCLGLFMILLSVLIVPIGILASQKYSEHRSKSYYILMMLGLSALIGFFSAQNDITFYVFFELALIPFYFIVLMYGGADRKRAVFKFFLYTVFGSFLMLAAIIYFHSLTGINKTTDWALIYDIEIPIQAQNWILGALFIAFAIKSPLFPFHTWQSDLYTEGDRPTIIIIAGVLSKMGVFGFLRFYNVVNDSIVAYQTPLIIICVVGVIYGALIAWRQSEMTRVLAYSSLSHMGMIAAGLFTATLSGLQGSVFQMLSHGIVAAGLFFVVDTIMFRTQNNSIYGSSGIALTQPRLATYFFILSLASVGLPLTSGFIGEFEILLGLSQFNKWLAGFAGISIILGAIYTFRFYQKSMFGESNPDNSNWKSLSLNEDYILIVLAILIFTLGFFPSTWLDLADQATSSFVHFKSKS